MDDKSVSGQLARQNRRIIYGRRQGHKLHPRQQKLVDEVLPRVQPDFSVCGPAGWFENPFASYALEIGFGGGEHLAACAKAHRDIGYIGCEPFLNGVAKCLIEIDEHQLDNMVVHNDDARDVLAALPEASLGQAYLLYPDPWPKKRHHKRRFINPENVQKIFHVLQPGGRFFVASDIADYVDWTLMHLRAHGGFEWQAQTASDWQTAPADWPGTRYEAKALKAGRRPAYLQFIRRADKQPGQL